MIRKKIKAVYSVHIDFKYEEDLLIVAINRPFFPPTIKEFFYHLFEENDLVFCENNLDKFIKKMEINANIYAPIIEKLNNLFINTPIYK